MQGGGENQTRAQKLLYALQTELCVQTVNVGFLHNKFGYKGC